MALGFQHLDVQGMSEAHSDDHEACRSMLALWIEGDFGDRGPVTWTFLIEGLRDAGLMDLADDLNQTISILHVPHLELPAARIKIPWPDIKGSGHAQ